MNKHFKSNERELVKVATFFKRESKKLIDEGRLPEEQRKVGEAVDRFVEQMENHANTRAVIVEQRETLLKLVKDNAVCPRCKTSDKLKTVGVEKNEKGWKSNRYRCRKCNINFTWNRPNNPWDMMEWIRSTLDQFHLKLNSPETNETEKQQIAQAIQNMEENLGRIKPVIDAHDAEYRALEARDLQMEQLIHEFKNTLLIEKIKLDTWENKKRGEERK